MDQLTPRRTSTAQITINPVVVRACDDLAKEFTRAYLLAGAELSRQLATMMRRPS